MCKYAKSKGRKRTSLISINKTKQIVTEDNCIAESHVAYTYRLLKLGKKWLIIAF